MARLRLDSARSALLALAVSLTLSLVSAPSALAQGQTAKSDGAACSDEQARRIFVEQSCTRCHSLTTRDGSQELLASARPRGVTPVHQGSERMQPERIEKLLVKRTDGRGMRHPFHWKGTEQGLQCLVTWLAPKGLDGRGDSKTPDER